MTKTIRLCGLPAEGTLLGIAGTVKVELPAPLKQEEHVHDDFCLNYGKCSE